MANTGLINKIFSISPYIEILFRKIYWNNIDFFAKYNAKKLKNDHIKTKLTDFDKITKYLNEEGLGTGQIMIVHSSYESLENTKLNPNQVIQKLLDFVGEEGTLAMNSARKFKEEKDVTYTLKENYSGITCTYDLKKTKVWTGVLPFYMVRNPKAEISEFPINPMVAIGKKAKEMMKHNLNCNMAAGIGSSWNYCVENNAVIVGIGIDLTHSLTIIHVAEDANVHNWPIKNWYRNRNFLIINGAEKKEITVKERNPKWGTMHFAERSLCKDLIKNGILVCTTIDGVQVEYVYAKKLIDFLYSKNGSGYPYFGISKKEKIWN